MSIIYLYFYNCYNNIIKNGFINNNNYINTGVANGGEHLQRRGARDARVRAGVRRQRQPRINFDIMEHFLKY